MDPHISAVPFTHEGPARPDIIEIDLDGTPVVQAGVQEGVQEGGQPVPPRGWGMYDVMTYMDNTTHWVTGHARNACRQVVRGMDDLTDVVLECAEAAAKPIGAAYTCVGDTFTETGRALGRSYAWLDRKVVELSNEHLNPDLAALTIRAFRGAPFAGAYLVLPPAVVGVTCGAIFISSWLGHPPFSNETYRRFYDGWGMGLVVRLGVDTASFLTTGNPGFAIAATINLITAAYLFNKAAGYQ